MSVPALLRTFQKALLIVNLGSTEVGMQGVNCGFAYLALGQARDLYVKNKSLSSLHKGENPILAMEQTTIILHKAEHV